MIRDNKGFTLIEVIVTVTILGIVTTVAFPLLSGLIGTINVIKYEAYNSSIESAAKLYTDSYSADMFGNDVYGCYKILYSVLDSKNLVKDIGDKKSDCSNDSGTYVYVIKMGEHYVYQSSLVCVDSSGRELYNHSTITRSTCSSTDIVDSAPKIVLNPNFSLPVKTINVDVKLEGDFGYGLNQKVRYEWLDYSKNPIGESDVISYKNTPQETETPLLSKTISSPNNLTGIYYLKIIPINVSNYIEQDFNNNEYESSAYLLDNIAPNVSASYDINEETNNLTISLSDNMRLAYYAVSTTNSLPNDSSSLWKSTGDVTSFTKILSKNEGTYYIFVKDYAGNTNKKAITI